jgi:hypothetical protein
MSQFRALPTLVRVGNMGFIRKTSRFIQTVSMVRM